MNLIQITVRLLLAVVCGGIVGWERERHHKPAGFRTHILVCMGSALFMLVSLFLHEQYKDEGLADPGRIAAQVVTGIGFICAGTIWVSQNMVRGLTTAASLWTVAGIGLAIGCGFYRAGLVASVIIFVVLRVLQRMEDSWIPPTDSLPHA